MQVNNMVAHMGAGVCPHHLQPQALREPTLPTQLPSYYL